MSRNRCCVPGCVEGGSSHSVLHGFPNPEKYPELFNSWIYAVGGDILGLDNQYVYKLRRVCHSHFEAKYHCRFNRISKLAVPTINLPGPLAIPKFSFRECRPLQAKENLVINTPSTSEGKGILPAECKETADFLLFTDNNLDSVNGDYNKSENAKPLLGPVTPNSQHRKLTTVVTKCEETKEPIIDYGKVTPFVGYEVELEDTILFPAGGGQPHDTGRLNDVEVVQVLRRGEKAVHFTKEPMEVGTEVIQKLDWDRRFDHMQQHSGQHLLSAILENEQSITTTSWWLGAEECYVELDSTNVSDDVIHQVEARCNELIRSEVPVKVKFCKADDPELDKAHTRGLPKDCSETLRLICIENIDENLCCGTHVSNLSQLQVIKLLSAEPGKKGKTNLKFLVGNRVINTFQRMLDREKALTGLLKNEPSKHEELIQKLQKNLKIATKNLQNVLSELAQFEIDKIKRSEPKPNYVFMFKKEATPDFNRAVSKGLENERLFVFLASEDPDKPKEGQIMIQGPQEHWDALGQQIAELLKGKGAFKNGKFQGKAGDLGGINRCKKLIDDYFKNACCVR